MTQNHRFLWKGVLELMRILFRSPQKAMEDLKAVPQTCPRTSRVLKQRLSCFWHSKDLYEAPKIFVFILFCHPSNVLT